MWWYRRWVQEDVTHSQGSYGRGCTYILYFWIGYTLYRAVITQLCSSLDRVQLQHSRTKGLGIYILAVVVVIQSPWVNSSLIMGFLPTVSQAIQWLDDVVISSLMARLGEKVSLIGNGTCNLSHTLRLCFFNGICTASWYEHCRVSYTFDGLSFSRKYSVDL